MRIAIDFDGVLVKRKGIPRKGDFFNDPPQEDAVDAIKWLLDQGHDLWIYTAREKKWHNDIRKWLKRNDLPDLPIEVKKEATIYLDDRAIRFTNWQDFCKLLG